MIEISPRTPQPMIMTCFCALHQPITLDGGVRGVVEGSLTLDGGSGGILRVRCVYYDHTGDRFSVKAGHAGSLRHLAGSLLSIPFGWLGVAAAVALAPAGVLQYISLHFASNACTHGRGGAGSGASVEKY